MREQPWLESLNDELLYLLEECSYERQQALILELLNRFVYLDDSKANHLLENATTQIFDVWGLEHEKTQIVAMTYDDSPDSAQSVLWRIKPLLAKINKQPKLVNKLGRAVKNIEACPNIILLDEFAGTGKTLANRVKQLRSDIRNYFSNKGYSFEVSIRAILLSGMENSKPIIDDLDIAYFCPNWLQKGIAHNYSGKKLKIAYKDMLKLESKLANEVSGRSLPSLGYGRAEALYYQDHCNLPNSVFPVFWWPKSFDGSTRTPLLFRFQE